MALKKPKEKSRNAHKAKAEKRAAHIGELGPSARVRRSRHLT